MNLIYYLCFFILIEAVAFAYRWWLRRESDLNETAKRNLASLFFLNAVMASWPALIAGTYCSESMMHTSSRTVASAAGIPPTEWSSILTIKYIIVSAIIVVLGALMFAVNFALLHICRISRVKARAVLSSGVFCMAAMIGASSGTINFLLTRR